MADNHLYETSNATDSRDEPFIKREVIYVLDQNNGNYNGQILMDTSTVSNSGKWASYSEAYLVVPLVVGVTCGTALANPMSAFTVGLKNGYFNLIHSIGVEYNNTSVVQLSPFTNFYVSYKLMTELSHEDVLKHGPSIGFFPDNANSMSYNVAIDKQGLGVCNNQNGNANGQEHPVVTGAYLGEAFNKGFYERQKNIAYDGTIPFMTSGQANTVGKNNVALGTTSAYYYVMAKIRLKDICDFFDKIPLVKGAFIKLTINTNTAKHTVTYGTVAGVSGVTTQTASITGGSSPLLLASMEDNNGGSKLTTAQTYTIECAIGTLNNNSGTIKGVRLYVPLYTMNPLKEEAYIMANKTKTFSYRDIYNYQITGITANSTFNSLLTNGVPNPKTIIIIPFINSSYTYNSTGGTAQGIAQYQSIFDTAPSTTCPYASITNFNVQISGVNMFVQNEIYDFEQFMNELKSQNSLNGGLTSGLTSGLINELSFQQGYRYYVCDVARRLPAEDSIPKSVQILGQNNTNVTLDFMCFVEFQKECTIDLVSGMKIQ